MRLVSAPLEVLGLHSEEPIQLHHLPSSHPSIDDDQCKQPALRATSRTDGKLVLALTPFADSHLVEIRTLSLGSGQPDPAAHHILFPAPLLPGIHLSNVKEHGVVILQTCTATGYLYRLRIVLSSLPNVTDIPSSWIVERRLNAVSSDAQSVLRSNMLKGVHGSSDGQVVLVSCTDGRIVKLLWEGWADSDRGQGGWRESVLRPSTFFGRFFARGGPSSNSSSQILSMETLARSSNPSETLAFTVSQDRRLRVWDMGSDACIRTIDLPSSISRSRSSDLQLATQQSGVEAQQDQTAFTYDRPALMRIVSTHHADASSPYAAHLLIALPPSPSSGPFLACYGIQLEAASSSSGREFAGSVGDIDLLWEKNFDKQYSTFNVELRDVEIVEQGSHWHIWCVWDADGRNAVQSLRVRSPFDDAVNDRVWGSVSLPLTHSPLHGQALDRDLEAIVDAADLGSFMLDRITEANRFSLSSLERAIKGYKDSLLGRGEDPINLPPPGSSGSNVREQVLALVGCTVQLQKNEATGADLQEQYLSSLKREWAIFIGLLTQIDSDDRWPIGFAPQDQVDGDGSPFVISRGWISLPTEEDLVSEVLRRSKEAVRNGSDVQSQQGDEVDADALATIAFSLRLRQGLQAAALGEFEATILNLLANQPSAIIEDAVEELWTSVLQDSLIMDDATIKEEFGLLGNEVISVLGSVSDWLSGASHEYAVDHGNVKYSELFAALLADDLTQKVADRLQLCKLIIVLCAAISSGFLELEAEVLSSSSVTDTLRRVISHYQRLFALDLISHYDGTAELRQVELDAADEMEGGSHDADAVATRIGNLNFQAGTFGENASDLDGSAANVLHKAVLQGVVTGGATGDDLSTQVSTASAMALRTLLRGSGQEDSPLTEMNRKAVQLANFALRNGHPSATLSFVRVFPRTAAGTYLVGRSLLALEEVDSSAELFDQVLATFEHWTEERSAIGSGLALVLPPNISNAGHADMAAFHFCRLIISCYRRARALPQLVHFCLSALKYAQKPGCIAVLPKTRDLHLSLFRSCVDLELYDDAYTHLLAIPFDDLQRESLRTFIAIMCESGRVKQLLSYNFAGLQSEVERTLSFKARNSDPLSEDGENYYNILYAFHTRRGDLKSAGATMWQMGARINDSYRRRLAQTRRSNVGGLLGGARAGADADLQRDAIIEARCYLASVNALSLIDEKDAWFAHEVADDTHDDDAIGASKLSTYLPPSSFQQRPREIRIVDLNDVRRKYQLLLAQLELITLYPDEASAIISSTPADGANAVLLAVRNQDYELAFTLALNNKLDRTEAYLSLTDKCLELTRWEELRAERNRLADGQEEHPLMKALYDDRNTSSSTELLGSDTHSGLGAEQAAAAMPSARFLDRSDRCVMWTGPPASRAWRYLRLWLSFEVDGGSTDAAEGRYRLAVLNRILDRRLWRMSPSWLTSQLRAEHPEALIKALMDHELLLPALNESLELVKVASAQAHTSIKRRRVGTAFAHKAYLPYLLFDLLLERSQEAVKQAGADDPSQFGQQRTVAKALRDAIEEHKHGLRRLESDTRRNMAEDDKRARRMGEAQRQQQAGDVEMDE